MKKIIIILIIIIVVGSGAYIAWKLFFASTPSEVTEEGASLPAAGTIDTFTPGKVTDEILTELAEELITLSSMPIVDYWINKNTGDIFYIDSTGNIYKNSLGQEEKASSQVIENIHFVKSSADGSKAIISFGYPFETTFTIWNTANNTWQPLPAGTISAAWDPQSNNRVAYLINNRINIITLSDKKISEITKLNQKGLDLEWILPDVLYLKQKPSAEYSSSIWLLNIKARTLEPLIKDEPGLIVKWSSDGGSGLKFQGNGLSNLLTLIDSKNRALLNLDFVTLPSKCTFDQDKIYCAIPASIPPRTSLPDDYFKRKIALFDHLVITIDLSTYKIDFMAGVLSPSVDLIDADHLSIQNNRLLFVNRYDQKLYSLEIE